jgi:hypothetical protein
LKPTTSHRRHQLPAVASLTTSLWATKVEDFWNQYYFGATHVLGDSQVLSLTTGLNYYKTVDEGKRRWAKSTTTPTPCRSA